MPGNRLHWVQMPSKQRSIPAEIAVPCISRLNLHPSQTESCSRRNRCSNRYPILRRYKGLAPRSYWALQQKGEYGGTPEPSFSQGFSHCRARRKMVASRKDLADAIQSYSDNDNHPEKMGNRIAHGQRPRLNCRHSPNVSSRVIDARSKERPLSSTSQPANIANGDSTPEETNARTVITSFDTLRWGEIKGTRFRYPRGDTGNRRNNQQSQFPNIVQSIKEH